MKVEFLTPLRVEALLGDQWQLLSDFQASIDTDTSHEILTVPKGFVTDLATVPRLPGMFLLFGGKGRKAAVLHDYLYWMHDTRREWADQVFFAAMATDENLFTRVAMWLGVRVGGWAIWERRPVPTIPS